uniref:CSON004705 protein n=1 Tax=Culicoides sonorensis TaxID=179676 RepID=A0A336LU66_CULSO
MKMNVNDSCAADTVKFLPKENNALLPSNSNNDLKIYTQKNDKLRFSSAPLLSKWDNNNLKEDSNNTQTNNINNNDKITSSTKRTAIFRQVSSIHSLASPVGAFLSGSVMERFGRRPAMMISTIPLILCWLLIALSQNHYFLLVGRFFGGFSTGLMGAPSQVWLAEIADPAVRGILIGLTLVTYSIGILFVYFLGSFLYWRYVAWASIVIPLIACGFLYFAPESPVWLTRHGQVQKASEALNWLRASDELGEKELQDLITRFERERSETTENIGFFKTISKLSTIKPLFIVNAFYILQVFSGSYLVVFYAVDIIQDFQSEHIDSMTAAVYTALIRMLFCLMYCFLVLKMHRRPLTIMSTGGSGAAAGILAIYLYTKIGQPKTQIDVFITAMCILFYLGFNTGLLTLPGIMTGELLPAKIRSQVAGSIFCMFNLVLFGTAKVFPYWKEYLKVHGVFAIFSFSSFLCAFMCYWILPETKTMTLGEIEDYFNEKNLLWKNRVNKDKEKQINA